MQQILLFTIIFNAVCRSVTLGSKSRHVVPFFNEGEISHNRHIREDKKAPCNEDTLINYLAEIQVITPESIVNLATITELEPSCKKVSENLQQIKDYLKTCEPSNQPDLYMQLIKGVESLKKKICTECQFRKDFEKVYKCVHELKNDFEDCGGPPDWNENTDSAGICKAYKDISDCYYIKTAKVCGNAAAATMKDLIESIVDSILTVKCPNVKPNPVVKDAMPEDYIRKTSGSNRKYPPRNIPGVLLTYYIISILYYFIKI